MLRTKSITVSLLAFLLLFAAHAVYSTLPPDNQYVVVHDGHITLDGQRMRFWGAVGKFPGSTYADNEAAIKRLKALGFNMIRFWTAPEGDGNYTKGDGSKNDLIDHFIYTVKKEGMYIWYAGLNRVENATPADVSITRDPGNESSWIRAVQGTDGKGVSIRNHPARVWDERLHALGIARMKAIASHYNQYTELKYADDPVMAVWELSNEEWWFGRTVSRIDRVDPFFKKSLIKKWNEFLSRKYRDNRELSEAWLGLLPGESLKKSNIQLLPLMQSTEVDIQRKALGVGIEDGTGQKLGINDFNRQRGEDVVEFMLEIWLNHKQAEHNALKTWGKSTALSPLVWDTGIGHEIQSQYLHQLADAVTHCTYLTGFHHDPTHERYPWISRLEAPPSTSWKDPWLEQNRVEGKPFFVYETQIHNPAKYRVEFPMQMAALGSIQDYDIIIWHYWGFVPDHADDNAYNKPMDYSRGGVGHPEGLHFIYDEVQQSAMTAASAIFRNFQLVPAFNPTTFVFGKESLLDPRALEGVSYPATSKYFVPTTYRNGSRMLIDTNRVTDTIIGPVIEKRGYEPNPYKPTENITYNWREGFLKLDAPGVKSFTGFLKDNKELVNFEGELTLSDVTFVNPEGIAYPVEENERFLSFTLSSSTTDDLNSSQEMIISLASTSFNKGFELNHDEIRREFGWFFKENAKATVSVGKAPVQVVRVGGKVTANFLDGLAYQMFDWNMKVIEEGVIEGGELMISPAQPVFITRIFRSGGENINKKGTQ
jgi:hypothetical protein